MEFIKINYEGTYNKEKKLENKVLKVKNISHQEMINKDKHKEKVTFGEKRKLHIERYIEEFIKGQDMESRKSHSVKNSLYQNNILNKYVYNEASFQHELAEYLMDRLSRIDEKFVVQFERNIKDFGYSEEIDKNNKFKKREIDIVIINQKTNDKYAIELKYHNAKYGEIPDVMYNCIKDMEFMYNCLELGFKQTYCVSVVEDKGFYTGKVKTGIYRFFRDENQHTNLENEAFLQRKDVEVRNKSKINISHFKEGRLPIIWKKIDENLEGRYYILKFDKK